MRAGKPRLRGGENMKKTTKRVILASTVLGVGLVASSTFAATNGAAAIQGKISANDGSSLTITTVKNKSINVAIDGATKLYQKFFGKTAVSDMQKGDKVLVRGKWTDQNRTAIDAKVVMDMSIQKRHAVFHGTVQSLTSEGFVLQSRGRGQQTVTITSSTKLFNKERSSITENDIAVGNKVVVAGVWDRTNKTIEDATSIRDLSL